MPGKGCPPKPTKLIKGWRKGLRKDEPQIDPLDFKDMPPPPYLSKEAKVVWKRWVPPIAKMKILSESDIEGLATMCDLRAEYIACRDVKLKKEIATQVRAMMQEYGATPSARTRVKVEKKQDKSKDPAAEWAAQNMKLKLAE